MQSSGWLSLVYVYIHWKEDVGATFPKAEQMGPLCSLLFLAWWKCIFQLHRITVGDKTASILTKSTRHILMNMAMSSRNHALLDRRQWKLIVTPKQALTRAGAQNHRCTRSPWWGPTAKHWCTHQLFYAAAQITHNHTASATDWHIIIVQIYMHDRFSLQLQRGGLWKSTDYLTRCSSSTGVPDENMGKTHIT